MKSKGIVRRIDDLGRIVIPKEIRKTLRIGEGDKVEILLNQNNEIILKKYSSISDIWTFANDYASCLHKFLNLPIIIFDNDKVLVAYGKPKNHLQDQVIDKKLDTALRKKQILKSSSITNMFFYMPEEQSDLTCEYIVPIIQNGDVIGGICAFSNHDLKEAEENLIKVTASFLGKHMEYV